MDGCAACQHVSRSLLASARGLSNKKVKRFRTLLLCFTSVMLLGVARQRRTMNSVMYNSANKVVYGA